MADGPSYFEEVAVIPHYPLRAMPDLTPLESLRDAVFTPLPQEEADNAKGGLTSASAVEGTIYCHDTKLNCGKSDHHHHHD